MQHDRIAASLGRSLAVFPRGTAGALAGAALAAALFFAGAFTAGVAADPPKPVPRRVVTVAPRPVPPVATPVLDAAPPHFRAVRWPGGLGYLPDLSRPAAPDEDVPDPSNPNRIGGVDYSDPVGGGAVPLVKVAGRRGERLSRGFRVDDFASNDGAAYARISDPFVRALEKLRSRAGSLFVISAYRHPAYNTRVEGSAAGSQHIAGRAADVWSGTKTPLEMAGLALETMGCTVGLGLGPNSLHVDARGRLASWTYRGAALSEAAFDAWVAQRCGVAPADETDVHDAPADSTDHLPALPDSSAATVDSTRFDARRGGTSRS